MKKIILLVIAVVVIVALSLVGFMGCQGQTSLTQIFSDYNVWRAASMPETFTYSMFKGEETESMGTLTLKVETLEKNKTYYIGENGLVSEAETLYSFSTESVNDTYLATTTLQTADGSYSKTSFAAFTKSYQLLACYSKTVENDTVYAYAAHNVDNKKYYYRTSNDWTAEKTIKNGKYQTAPYFDNSMVYFVARSIPEESDYTSFTFNIFDLDKGSKEKVTLSNPYTTVNPVYIIGSESPVNSRAVTMKTSDALIGTTNNVTCFVATKSYNGYKNVITKIIEGNYSYILNA